LMLTTHPAKRAPAAPRRTGRERSGAQSKDASSSGCIINIADQAALRPWPSYIAHTVSKAGLVTLTKTLALALAPSIRVNAIAPGSTLTPLVQQGLDDGSIGPDFLTEIPMRRFGQPEEVANVVTFLASARASWVLGATVNVDGGQSRSNI